MFCVMIMVMLLDDQVEDIVYELSLLQFGARAGRVREEPAPAAKGVAGDEDEL
jgi:hypothetical protein